MATLPTLRPNGEELGAWGAWSVIDDDPDSPNDSDFASSPNASDDTSFWDLTDMPADFSSLTDLTYNIRARATSLVNDTLVLYAQIFDSTQTTTLSNEITVRSFTAPDSAFANFSAALTGLVDTSNKAAWDDAGIRLRVDWGSVMGADSGVHVDVSGIEINGNYTAAAAAEPSLATALFDRRTPRRRTIQRM